MNKFTTITFLFSQNILGVYFGGVIFLPFTPDRNISPKLAGRSLVWKTCLEVYTCENKISNSQHL